MPDLIIKPQTNSGDRLRLQDRTGTDVLTTADSGATYANATLTTPTIANMANCTFPVGHVVQTVHVTYNSGSTSNNTGGTMVKAADSSGNNHWKASISGLLTDSDVLIMATFMGSMYDADTSTAQGCFGFLRDDDGSDTNLTTIMDGSVNDWYSNKGGHSGTNDHYQQFTLMYYDASPTQTAHTYYLGSKTGSGSGIMVRSDSTQTPFTMILQEIKR